MGVDERPGLLHGLRMTSPRPRGLRSRPGGDALAVTAYLPVELGTALKRRALDRGESITDLVESAVQRELDRLDADSPHVAIEERAPK